MVITETQYPTLQPSFASVVRKNGNCTCALELKFHVKHLWWVQCCVFYGLSFLMVHTVKQGLRFLLLLLYMFPTMCFLCAVTDFICPELTNATQMMIQKNTGFDSCCYQKYVWTEQWSFIPPPSTKLNSLRDKQLFWLEGTKQNKDKTSQLGQNIMRTVSVV